MDVLKVKVNGNWVGIPSIKGDPGSPGDPTQIIDDTAGSSTTNKTWSVNKIASEIANGSTVTDVQVNGISVLSNGVANVPLADTSTFGVVKVGSGLTLYNNALIVNLANSSQIKGGTAETRPIVPKNQHESVFYGLTKAAGADMASSANAVGVYTPEAKAAIWQMLGLDGSAFVKSDWELIKTVTTTEDLAELTIDTDSNGNAFELTEMHTRVSMPQTTTGTQDYIKGSTIFNHSSGSVYYTGSLPTLRYTGATSAGFFEYHHQLINDFVWITARNGNSNVNSQNVNGASFPEVNSQACVLSINGIKLEQYNSSSTLIPSGTSIKIYGKRKRAALDSPVINVTGTTPSITALPGHRYICGEVSTLSITAPASGCVDVVFESGSTATVLTITPPTGQTVKWANGFDPTSLDANTTYEINILDGCLGVVGSWI